MSVIPAAQEPEAERSQVQDQPNPFCETLPQNKKL